MTRQLSIVLFALFTVFACTKDGEDSNQTDPLVSYLQKVDTTSEVPDSIKHYILIPSIGCRACQEGAAIAWLNQFHTTYYLVVANKSIGFKYGDSLKLHQNYFYDSKGDLNRINRKMGSFNLVTLWNSDSVAQFKSVDVVDSESQVMRDFLIAP